MDLNTALIGLVAVILVIERFRRADTLEQIRAERNEVRRDEHTHHAKAEEHAFALYHEAVNRGYSDGRDAYKRKEK